MILPVITFMYLFNGELLAKGDGLMRVGLDRSNIGNAATVDFFQDIHSDAISVNNAVTLFNVTCECNPFILQTNGSRLVHAHLCLYRKACWIRSMASNPDAWLGLDDPLPRLYEERGHAHLPATDDRNV